MGDVASRWAEALLVHTPGDDVSVVFTPAGVTASVASGTTLLDAARGVGVDLDSTCGGRGLCGRCQITVAAGEFAKYGVSSSPENLTPIGDQETRFRDVKPLAANRRLGSSFER